MTRRCTSGRVWESRNISKSLELAGAYFLSVSCLSRSIAAVFREAKPRVFPLGERPGLVQHGSCSV